MSIAVPRALRRALIGAAVGATAAAGVAVAQIAPTSPPEVTVTLGGKTAQVQGADGLLSGAVELTFASGGRPATALAFRLPAGADLDAFGRKVAKLRDPSSLTDDGSFEAFAVVGPKGSYTTTIDARDGRYAIVDLPRKGAPQVVGSFDVGAGTAGAVAPKPDATITLREYGIGAPRAIPGKGVVRVRNTGKELHELVAAKIGKGQSQNEALRLLREGQDRKVRIEGAPGPIVGLVSPGTTNDVQVSLPKGRYVLVCFYADRQSKGRSHISLGMGGAIKVR